MKLNIPGKNTLTIEKIVFDFNGTIACDGEILKQVKEKIRKLSEEFNVLIVTADTYGTVRNEFAGENVEIKITKKGISGSEFKKNVIKEIGGQITAAIGNGYNDAEMIKDSILGILVIGAEGAATKSLLNSNIVVKDINDAFDLFLFPDRLKATLRK